MLVIYHCFGGSHSSVTAAAMHLGLLPRDRRPTAAELLALPYFDGRSRGEEGELKFMGTDLYGNRVFAVGKKNLGDRFEALLYGLAGVMGIPRREILLLNTSHLVNFLMRLGGFTSRRLGLTPLGRPVVVWGTRRACSSLAEFVAKNRPLWARPQKAAGPSPGAGAMIIIYACFSGTHAAVIAAALHAGWLDADHLPSWDKIKSLPCFDTPEGEGGMYYLGRTPAGHTLYTTAVGHDGLAARQAVKTFLEALNRDPAEVLWIDVSRRVSFLWRVSAFCRRYRRLAWLGQLLMQRCLERDYSILAHLAREASQQELYSFNSDGPEISQMANPGYR